METVLPLASNWTMEQYDGNPLTIGSEAFAAYRLRKTLQIPTIDFHIADLPLDMGTTENKHYRFQREYRFTSGIYEIQAATDDGMRMYAQSPDKKWIQLPAFKNGIAGNAWVVQSETIWTWKLDTKLLGFSGDATTILRIESFNKEGIWTAALKYIKLLSAYQIIVPQPPPITNPPPIVIISGSVQPPPSGSTEITESLLGAIQFSKQLTERTYRRGTLTPCPSDEFTITNVLTYTTVLIEFVDMPGVHFSPPICTLPPQISQKIIINFDPLIFEQMGNGTAIFDIAVNRSATAVADRPTEGDRPIIIPEIIPDNEPIVPVPTPTWTIKIISGNNQSAPVGTLLSLPLVVQVVDNNSRGQSGLSLIWTDSLGNGELSESPVTDSQGYAQINWTLGIFAGVQSVGVTIDSPPTGTIIVPATFVANATKTPDIISDGNEVNTGGSGSPGLQGGIGSGGVITTMDPNTGHVIKLYDQNAIQDQT